MSCRFCRSTSGKRALLVGPDDRVTDECFDFAAAFSAQVERSPDAVAVECRGEIRTYAELNREAERIARALTVSGIGPDKIVALLLDRGIGLLTAIVGVFEGGRGVPAAGSLPPSGPLGRIDSLERGVRRHGE
jgi:non-ribosomal peptide synthetase component F